MNFGHVCGLHDLWARMKILGMSEDLAISLKEFLGTSYAFWIRLACLGKPED